MPRLESPADPSIRRTGRRSHPMRVSTSLAEINVVPLVDVMLVLLVIFMVTAPMMQQGYAVSLPQASHGKPLSMEPLSVTVPASFHQDGRLLINDKMIPLSALSNRIRQEFQTRASKDVVFFADDAISYGDYMRVVDVLKGAGVQNLNLATQPPRADR